jgi:hypothetical protein
VPRATTLVVARVAASANSKKPIASATGTGIPKRLNTKTVTVPTIAPATTKIDDSRLIV